MRISRVEIEKLPKIELHCHLDGSISLKTIRALAKRADIKVPKLDADLRKKVQAPEDAADLMSYLAPFDYVLPMLQTEEALALAAFDVIEQVISEQIRYIEVRFAPSLHTAGGLSLPETVKAVVRGLEAGQKRYGVKSNVILSGMRNESVSDVMKIVELFENGDLTHLAGFDLAGEELDGFPDKFAPVLEKVRENKIPLTLHAGECGCAQNVIDAVAAGATRIGHGVAIKDRPETWAELAEKKITLEMAPTSNFQTKAIDSLENYPFKKLFDAGVRVTVNTDNRTVSGTTLNDEYEKLAKWYNFNESDFRQLANYAFEASFMSNDDRKDLGKEFGAVVKAKLPTLALDERIARLDGTMNQKVLSAKKEVFNRAKLSKKIHFIREEGKSMSAYLTKYLITSIIKFAIFAAGVAIIIGNFGLMFLGMFNGILGKETFKKILAKNPLGGLFHAESRVMSIIGLTLLVIIVAFVLFNLFKIAFRIKADDDYMIKYSFHKNTTFANEVKVELEKQDYYDLKANKSKLLAEKNDA
ncbi:adenosine deaminase [Lactococcus insecticola]|uniref:adenosine deaminase n=1 Tax=Pseudolactococcus insecticola TaxID=2709158 RepID=A0A6A0B881_9LACT|nr:adenosine deaminase [Lactococcus insecticola]GFH40668.1 hypothetical protein Hs20B_10660 [Lactococcus insecticola]